ALKAYGSPRRTWMWSISAFSMTIGTCHRPANAGAVAARATTAAAAVRVILNILIPLSLPSSCVPQVMSAAASVGQRQPEPRQQQRRGGGLGDRHDLHGHPRGVVSDDVGGRGLKRAAVEYHDVRGDRGADGDCARRLRRGGERAG